MVTRKGFQSAQGASSMGEDWWAALLAEEEKYTLQPLSRALPEIPTKSKKNAPDRQEKTIQVDWECVQELYNQDQTVHLQVTGHNRGGLLVDGDGLHGFVPVSHLVDISAGASEADREQALACHVGRSLCLKVIECNQERGRVVFSQRAALAGNGRRNQLFDTLKIGERVYGVVTNITDFGVFVDLDGVEGLIHISEISWGRVHHPAETLALGDEVEALIINLDKEHARVALSLKRLLPNPWDTAESRYFPGLVTEATITSIVPFGIFARLEEGLDGLIHISEITLDEGVTNLSDVMYEGQRVRVRVLHVDAQRQRLGLSLCQDI